MDINKISSYCNLYLKYANELEGKYIALHLTPDSKKLLLETVPPKFGVKMGKKKMAPGTVFADHVTVEVEPTEDLLEMFGEGERVPIQVVGVCHDDKAQAAIVSLPEFFDQYIREKNRFPHITISTLNVPPSYSNELVQAGTNFEQVSLMLQGYVKFMKTK